MFYNYNIYFVLIIGIVLFFIGRLLCEKINSNKLKVKILLILILISIPAMSFIIYYFHVIDNQIWYIEFRSINNIEKLTMFLGILIGYISKLLEKKGRDTKRIIIYLGMNLIFLIIPFIKPIISPIKRNNTFENEWKDGVCIQTTGSTCGPSSLATILKFYGIEKTEEEISKKAFTSGTSTEIWYLIRYARKEGLKVKVYKNKDIKETETPAIIGTKLGENIGHFITILSIKDNKLIIGDSLEGKKEMTEEEFLKEYRYEKIGISIKR